MQLIKIRVNYPAGKRLNVLAPPGLSISRVYEFLRSKGKPLHIHMTDAPATAEEIDRAKRQGLYLDDERSSQAVDR